jgi:hypothetical protein
VTRAEAFAMLRTHRLAVIGSLSATGPQAALVGIAVTEALDIVFDTVTTSRKFANVIADPRVALVIGWDAEQTIQYEGIADVPEGDDLIACKRAYFEVWPDGRERERWPDIAYIRVRPRWLRYSDFGRAPPRIEELTLA